MSTSTYRWGELKSVSKDKGPYKLGGFEADGKPIVAKIMETQGVECNPVDGSIAFIICPDGDEGRAMAFVVAPAKLRTDQQKEGEVNFKNHKRGQNIKLDDNGDILANAIRDMVATALRDMGFTAERDIAHEAKRDVAQTAGRNTTETSEEVHQINAKTIILNGKVILGGEKASRRVIRVGDVDSGSDEMQGGKDGAKGVFISD